MNFLNPLGLIGLLGVPLLIVLYILKQKHTEKAVSSSFIWKRSELLFKKNIRYRIFHKYLLLALQLLIFIILSLVVAKAVINQDIPSDEYIVVLDASGSMMAETDGKSRFENAIEQISDLAKDMNLNSSMTVILANENTSYLIKRSESSSDIEYALKNAQCSYGETDIEEALKLADAVSSGNDNTRIVLYTDKVYEETGDIRVVNVSDNEWNASVVNFSSSVENASCVFLSTVASYGADADLTIALYVDGVLKDAQKASCKDGEALDVYWENLDVESFSNAEVVIAGEDAINEDNSYSIFGNENSESDILIISKESFFIRRVLKAIGNVNITYFETLEEATADEQGISGYALYIFDGCVPDSMPQDGAIWLFNPNESTSGIVLGDSIANATDSATLSMGIDSGSTAYSMLTNYIKPKEITVSKYTKAQSFTGYEVLFQSGSTPVVLSKEEDTYIKTVVMLFDIHDSNLPLLIDFPVLISNMLTYSVAPMVDKNDYASGETVETAPLPNCTSITVTPKNADAVTVSLVKKSFLVETPGVYTVTEYISGTDVSTSETAEIFVHIPSAESDIYIDGGSLGLGASTAEIDEDATETGFWNRLFESITNRFTKAVSLWPYLAVILIIILTVEWWVYYNEEL